jgi:4-methyl-5(b-hydroxyethyl)-thiazole monophosphate biosynthesis
MKTIAILVAPGFEEIEFSAPLDILRRLEFDVTTVGVQDKQVTGAHGLPVITDTTLDQISPADIDALILPGGNGSWVMRDTEAVLELVRQVNSSGKLVAAICAAPIALARAGILEGKKVSAYPADMVYADLTMATIQPDRVTVDGNILTANGPGSALAFGYALAEYLGKGDLVPDLKKAMIYGCPSKD